jgi:hypothetical protein
VLSREPEAAGFTGIRVYERGELSMDPIVVRPMAKGFILAKDLINFYLFFNFIFS